MAAGWRGVATGALALVALETLVQQGASGRVATLFGLPATWARRFIDPTIPAFHTGAAPAVRQIPGSSAFSPNPSGATTPSPSAVVQPGGGVDEGPGQLQIDKGIYGSTYGGSGLH